ncbi:MAG: hypothetical protein RBR86_05405 [Pseudobdellovibrionaceae bacterium]|jgi:hypothetical protein|nr:hypothetical protein [Pseudobdellovibrionaceae bacterium]
MIVRYFMTQSGHSDESIGFLVKNFQSVVGLVAKKCLANFVRSLEGSSQAHGNAADMTSMEDRMSGWN